MLENNKNNEVYLNLKMPEESRDDFSMQKIVTTIYNGRKMFFFWSCLGVVLALLLGGMYWITQGDNVENGQGYIVLTMNYPGAEEGDFPNSEQFDIRIFFETEIWRSALDNAGLTNVTTSDAVRQVTITPVQQTEEGERVIDRPLSFIVTTNPNSEVFVNAEVSQQFLTSFARAFKYHLNSEFISPDNVDFLWEYQLRAWKPMLLDEFCFRRNFDAVTNMYYAIERDLFLLHETSPSFVSSSGDRFIDLANEMREIRVGDLRTWLNQVNSGSVYIRNIDTFRRDSVFRVEALQINRNHTLEKIALYNELLTSFQQKDAIDGSVVWEAVNILSNARGLVALAADTGREIEELERNIRMIDEHEALFRTNANAAEVALQGFLTDLEERLQTIGEAIREHNNLENAEIAATSVLYTTPRVEQSTSGVSMIRLAMVVMVPLFGGIGLGICGAVIKSYLPEKSIKAKK